MRNIGIEQRFQAYPSCAQAIRFPLLSVCVVTTLHLGKIWVELEGIRILIEGRIFVFTNAITCAAAVDINVNNGDWSFCAIDFVKYNCELQFEWCRWSSPTTMDTATMPHPRSVAPAGGAVLFWKNTIYCTVWNMFEDVSSAHRRHFGRSRV